MTSDFLPASSLSFFVGSQQEHQKAVDLSFFLVLPGGGESKGALGVWVGKGMSGMQELPCGLGKIHERTQEMLH